MKKLVVLTGAGISQESNIPTFRDKNGMWETFNVEEYATVSAYKKDKEKIIDFYNQRAKDVLEKQPNECHFMVERLRQHFDMHVLTQNIDDLHEKAGTTTNITHLHGKIFEAKSTKNPSWTKFIGDIPIEIGDKCKYGSQLRHNIVFFGEQVIGVEHGANLVAQADLLLIIGTSLEVYPVNSLHTVLKQDTEIVYLDPRPNTEILEGFNVTYYPMSAVDGAKMVEDYILNKFKILVDLPSDI